MPNSPSAGDIDKLRQLLFEEDQEKIQRLQQEIEQIRQQISDKEALIETIDPVVGDAISRRIGQAKDEMAEALAPVMGAAIKTQIATAKDDIVDALYPVIGSTIRKAIAEAMRNLARSVNEQVERALSFRLWKQRIKARLTGVPQDQLILKEALPFTIHDILYIHRETGILLAHFDPSSTSRSSVDQELVGGMLSAITDFARSITEENEAKTLREIQYEDMTIFLEMGRHAWLAIVTSGAEPDHFRDQAARYENMLHNRFHKQLRSFDGDVSAFSDAHTLMRQLYNRVMHPEDIAKQTGAQEQSENQGLRYLFAILFIVVLFFAWQKVPDYLAARKLKAQLQEHLAATGSSLPSDLDLRVDGNRIVISGLAADAAQHRQMVAFLSRNADSRLVIDKLRNAGPAASLAQVREAAMQRLAGETDIDPSTLQFNIDKDVLTIRGTVSDQKQRLLVASLLAETLPFRVLINDLHIDSAQQADTSRIYFPRNSIVMTPADTAALLQFIKKNTASAGTSILVSGYSDASGTRATQKRIAAIRAENVRQFLIKTAGIPEDKITTRSFAATAQALQDSSESAQAQSRRVEVVIERK